MGNTTHREEKNTPRGPRRRRGQSPPAYDDSCTTAAGVNPNTPDGRKPSGVANNAASSTPPHAKPGVRLRPIGGAPAAMNTHRRTNIYKRHFGAVGNTAIRHLSPTTSIVRGQTPLTNHASAGAMAHLSRLARKPTLATQNSQVRDTMDETIKGMLDGVDLSGGATTRVQDLASTTAMDAVVRPTSAVGELGAGLKSRACSRGASSISPSDLTSEG